mgnify:CR=1 FL=1
MRGLGRVGSCRVIVGGLGQSSFLNATRPKPHSFFFAPPLLLRRLLFRFDILTERLEKATREEDNQRMVNNTNNYINTHLNRTTTCVCIIVR